MKSQNAMPILVGLMITGCGSEFEDIPSRLARGDTTVCAERELVDSVLQQLEPTGFSLFGVEIVTDEQAAQGVAEVGAFADTISAVEYDDAVDELTCEAVLNIEDSRYAFTYTVRPSADGEGYVYTANGPQALTAAWGAAASRYITDAIEASEAEKRAEAEELAVAEAAAEAENAIAEEDSAMSSEPAATASAKAPSALPTSPDGQWTDEEYAAARARQ